MGKAKWRETETKGSSLMEEAAEVGGVVPCARGGVSGAPTSHVARANVFASWTFSTVDDPNYKMATTHSGPRRPNRPVPAHHKIDQKTKMQSLYCPSVTLLRSSHPNIKDQ
jgi:hypothetical protein